MIADNFSIYAACLPIEHKLHISHFRFRCYKLNTSTSHTMFLVSYSYDSILLMLLLVVTAYFIIYYVFIPSFCLHIQIGDIR